MKQTQRSHNSTLRRKSPKREAQEAAGIVVVQPRPPIAKVGKAKKRKQPTESKFKRGIKRRDDWTCQICGLTADQADLEVHHLFTVGSHPELEFVAWNCLTLCTWDHQLGPEAAHRRMTEFRQVTALSFPWFAEKYDSEGDCVRLANDLAGGSES